MKKQLKNFALTVVVIGAISLGVQSCGNTRYALGKSGCHVGLYESGNYIAGCIDCNKDSLSEAGKRAIKKAFPKANVKF